jgi:hypothetical protein
MKNTTGRGWTPTTRLQEVLLSTYLTKEGIREALKVSQPTLDKLLLDQSKIRFSQIQTVSKDSKLSLIQLIKLI